MACDRRERTGSCAHFQCPFHTETKHGYHCVEIMNLWVGAEDKDLCEVGEDCLEKCEYSYKKGDISFEPHD